MTEFIKLALSLPLHICLIVVGCLLAAAFFFDEYMGFRPNESARRKTALLGMILMASGAFLLFRSQAQSSGTTHGKSDSEETRNTPLSKKYGSYNSREWRRNFLQVTRDGTWHVFVKTLSPECTESEAGNLAEALRKKYQKFDFNIMPTYDRQSDGNKRWAIVIAEGLSERSIAMEIAEYAKECGISSDAYAHQQ